MNDPAPPGRVFAAFRAVLCASTALLLILSRPLWLDGGDFPRIPFPSRWPAFHPAVAAVALAATLAGLALAAFGLAWRAALLVAAGGLCWEFLGDQDRFQAWAYQFVLVAVALAVRPAARGMDLARVYVVALYVHSGLSKLDASFCTELGPMFLGQLARHVGVDSTSWPIQIQWAASLGMPIAEIVLGIALVSRTSRKVAAPAAILLHVALMAVLGPKGLDHSEIVVAWNAAMGAEVGLLFLPRTAAAGAGPGPRGASETPSQMSLPSSAAAVAPAGGSRLGIVFDSAFVAVAAVLPLGERSGWFDSWPSHALYASHAERATVEVRDDAVAGLPESTREHIGDEPFGEWRTLNLTSWSRAARGVPIYPQARVAVGVAEALAGRLAAPGAVRVTAYGRADRWTGRRESAVRVGGAAIRGLGDSYRINAHPATPGG